MKGSMVWREESSTHLGRLRQDNSLVLMSALLGKTGLLEFQKISQFRQIRFHLEPHFYGKAHLTFPK